MKKQKKPSQFIQKSSSQAATQNDSSNRWRALISLWLVIHFFGLLLAFSANLVPSAMQRRLLDAMAPYLTVIHQSYGLIPMEMIQGVELDHPFLLEVHRQGDTSDAWQPVLPPGATDAGSANHRWQQFMRLAAIVTLEQQHQIVTGICEAAVRTFSRNDSSGVDGVRIVRQLVPSFEQAALIASGQGDLIRSELRDEVLYQASIVKFPDGRIAFVSESTPTRAAKSVNTGSDAKRTDTSRQP